MLPRSSKVPLDPHLQIPRVSSSSEVDDVETRLGVPLVQSSAIRHVETLLDVSRVWCSASPVVETRFDVPALDSSVGVVERVPDGDMPPKLVDASHHFVATHAFLICHPQQIGEQLIGMGSWMEGQQRCLRTTGCSGRWSRANSHVGG